MTTSEDEPRNGAQGPANEHLKMLDELDAKPTAKQPIYRDEISVWLDELSDEEFHRVLLSRTLQDAVGVSGLSLSAIRSRPALGHTMRELGLGPRQISASGLPSVVETTSRAEAVSLDGDGSGASNILPFLPRSPE